MKPAHLMAVFGAAMTAMGQDLHSVGSGNDVCCKNCGKPTFGSDVCSLRCLSAWKEKQKETSS